MLDLSTTFVDAVISFRHRYPCLDSAGNPTSWWNLSCGESLGWLKWHPGQDFSYRIIAAMHFQGTPLGGGYATADDCVGGWGGCGAGHPSGGGLVGVFDTLLYIVLDGGAIRILKAHCRVSFLEKRPLSCTRLQFTSTASVVR